MARGHAKVAAEVPEDGRVLRVQVRNLVCRSLNTTKLSHPLRNGK